MSLYHPGTEFLEVAPPRHSNSAIPIPVTATAVVRVSNRTGISDSNLRSVVATHQTELQNGAGQFSVASGFATRNTINIEAVGDDAAFFSVPHRVWGREFDWIDAPRNYVKALPRLYSASLREKFGVEIDRGSSIYGVSFPLPAASIYEAGVKSMFSVLEFANHLIRIMDMGEREAVLYTVTHIESLDVAVSVGGSVYGISESEVKADVSRVDSVVNRVRDEFSSDQRLGVESVVELVSQFRTSQ